MDIGDKVLTHQGESGVVLKSWDRDDGQYHWWVELHFTADNKEHVSVIPYNKSELTVEDLS